MSSLAQLYCFIRALSHKIRTPLAVIQNELTYIKTQLPAEECERAIEGCRRIKDVLSAVSKDISYQADLQPLQMPELGTLFPALDGLNFQLEPGIENEIVRVDKALLGFAFRGMTEFLAAHQKNMPLSYRCRAARDGSGLFIHLSGTFQAYLSKKADLSRTYVSFCEFSYLCLDNDSVLLPLVDAIICDHGWQISIELERETLSIVFRF